MLTPDQHLALEERRALGIPVIEEDAWKYARQDKAIRDLIRRKAHIVLEYPLIR